MSLLAAANEYFSQHLDAVTWSDAGNIKQQAALAQAERSLDPYRKRTIRARFEYAIFEQALWLLQSKSGTRAELQQAGVTSFSLGNMTEHYDTKGRPAFIAPTAWFLLEKSGTKVGQLK